MAAQMAARATIVIAILGIFWLVLPVAGPAQANDSETYRDQAFVLHMVQSLRQLNDEGVQQELKLASANISKIKQFGEQAKKDFADLNTADRNRRLKLLKDTWVPKARDLDQQLAALLDEKQRLRLRQIVYQRQLGAVTLLYQDVRDQLGLTDEQIARIERIHGEAETALERSSGSLLSLLQVRRVAMRGRTKALELLTQDQQVKWDKLLGAAF